MTPSEDRFPSPDARPAKDAGPRARDGWAARLELALAGCAARALPAPARPAKMSPPAATSEAVRKSMKGNKRSDTKPELLVRKRLRQAGLSGYRLQWKVPGRPDVAWPGKKVALFVNGCFWHRCPHCKPRLPKSNVEYWVVKFERNVERDERSVAELRKLGWTVHVVWECQLKKNAIDETFAELLPILADELGKELRLPDAGAPGGTEAERAAATRADACEPVRNARN